MSRDMPLVRRMVNRYMSRKISRVCGQKIPDTQCGFRMMHRDLIPDLLGGAEALRLRNRNANHRQPQRLPHRLGPDHARFTPMK